MKNVTLIGASGFVGTAILNELLARGHKVTAVVRNPENMSVSSPNLNTVKADVADTDALVDVCKGKDDLIVDENGNSHISVEDYAVAMLDELESPKHHQERFTIGY